MIRQINVITGVETQREMTEEEQAASDTATAQELADEPMREWKILMRKTDSGMPRYLEDLITINSFTMTPIMKVRYDEKKLLRTTKP